MRMLQELLWRYLQQLCRDESRFSFTNVQFAGDDNRLALDSEAQTLIVADGDTLKWLDVQKRSQTQIKTIGPPGINRLAVAPGRPGLVAFHTDRFQARSPTGEALLGGGLVPGLRDAPDSNCDVKLALSWDGALLAVSGSTSMVNFDKNMVRIVDVATGQPLGPGFRLGEKEAILSLAFSPDGTHLACGTLGTKIFILEVPSLKRVKVLTGHAAGVNSLAFDSAGSKLVSAGGDRQIRVWRVPDWGLAAWKIFLDSPMAAKVMRVYDSHEELLDADAAKVWAGRIKPFALPNLRVCQSADESKAINAERGGAIIIAGSGMANGGRVRHHLARNLANPNAHVLFVGYQADGTLGRLLVNGVKHVKLFGADIPVRAQIHTVGGLSAHADQQALIDWYGASPNHPPVALVHGENPARATLAALLHDRFATSVTMPDPGMSREV